MKNYRPVSSLPYILKLIKKVTVKQLEEHLTVSSLFQPCQSAYRKCLSTETALVKITNDILVTLDSHQCVLIVMLHLRAAFDTVNHKLHCYIECIVTMEYQVLH